MTALLEAEKGSDALLNEIYKNRDFFEESGLAALYGTVDDLSIFSVYKSMQDNPQYDACSKLQDELESKFKQEEEEMLIRLIKIRDTLWT